MLPFWKKRAQQLIIKITISKKKKNSQVMKKGENLHWNTDKGGVDLNYIFERDWLVELSDNKLSNNKLFNDKLSHNNFASELADNRTFLNQSQARKL